MAPSTLAAYYGTYPMPQIPQPKIETEEIDMTADASHDQHIYPHIVGLYKTLRKQLPFIDDDALNRILADTHQELCVKLQAQAPATEARKNRFDFFVLPPEIRNRIYEMILPINNNFCVQDWVLRINIGNHLIPFEFGDFRKSLLRLPSLCEVNQQIRKETLPIFYGQNTFTAFVATDDLDIARQEGSKDLRKWLHTMGPDQTKLIKNLTIRMPLPATACSWRGHCRGREPCGVEKWDCRAWVPKSTVDVAKDLKLLGAGVPPKSFRAEFGATIRGIEWSDWKVAQDLFSMHAGPYGRSDVLEWTAVKAPEKGEEVELGEEDLECPIWDEEVD